MIFTTPGRFSEGTHGGYPKATHRENAVRNPGEIPNMNKDRIFEVFKIEVPRELPLHKYKKKTSTKSSCRQFLDRSQMSFLENTRKKTPELLEEYQTEFLEKFQKIIVGEFP